VEHVKKCRVYNRRATIIESFRAGHHLR